MIQVGEERFPVTLIGFKNARDKARETNLPIQYSHGQVARLIAQAEAITRVAARGGSGREPEPRFKTRRVGRTRLKRMLARNR